MIKVACISDTHNYLDPRILDFIKNCDELWHAGDIGNIEILDRLKDLHRVRAVYGNIDDQKIRSEAPMMQRFYCEETEVLIKHIGGYPNKYDYSVRQIIKENPPDIFVSGHSHILKIMHDKKNNLLHLNPGAAGKSGFHKSQTAFRFIISGKKIFDMEVLDLKRQI